MSESSDLPPKRPSMPPDEANKKLAEIAGKNLTRYGVAWEVVAKACAKMSVEQIEQLAVGVDALLSEAHDAVNHPKHYTSHPSGVECIEVVRHFPFNLGNVIKYLWRAPLKGATLEDLKKARWYLDDAIRQAEAGASK